MSLQKNDVVYYKKKMNELLKQAEENGIKVSAEILRYETISSVGVYFEDEIGECTVVKVKCRNT